MHTLNELISSLRAQTYDNKPLAFHVVGPQGKDLDDATGALPLASTRCDSRQVLPHDLFVCKGVSFKASYLEQAAAQGAVCYVAKAVHAAELAEAAPSLPALIAEDEPTLRRIMALASAYLTSPEEQKIPIFGITGTKGKSSVAWMLRHLIEGAGIVGTITTYDGTPEVKSINTTPESPDVWEHIRQSTRHNLPALCLEISSQALKYDRVLGVPLDAACFLNIGKDHISAVEHPNFEDYVASKLKIFSMAPRAVINLDALFVERIYEAAVAQTQDIITLSSHESNALGLEPTYRATNIELSSQGTRFELQAPEGTFPFALSLPGRFNVDNALAAIALARLVGVSYERMQTVLAHIQIPGRMMLLKTNSSPELTGLVDYAHNKLSFDALFSSLIQEYPGYTLYGVFGAPGGKAEERREDLVISAAAHGVIMYLTEDDPWTEEPADIIKQMLSFVPAGAKAHAVVDREKAVHAAVKAAIASKKPALVCILAKGSDATIHRRAGNVPMKPDAQSFNDAVCAEGLLVINA